MQTPVTTSLYTIVQNISGSERFFGFLGDGGRRLDADEQYSVRGDLIATLGAGPKRKFTALEAALVDGSITIIRTPPPVLYDATADASFQLALDAGCLGTVDRTWDESGDSSHNPPTC